MVIHAAHMIENRERDETHATVELEKMRLIWSLVVGSGKLELAANGRPVTRIANGQLHPRLCDLSVCCNGNVLSREFVDCVFRGVIDCRAAPQNPSGAIPRGGSSDRSAGCPGLREE